MLRINPDLLKKITQIVSANPKADEDLVIDRLSDMPGLRIKKEAIKSGVKEYFKAKTKQSKPAAETSPEQTLQKLKKKVKRSEIDIEFEDHPSYRFQKLGGILETLAEIQNNILLPIQQAEVIQQLGVTPCKGFLLAGPVGSGKTILANCILSHLVNKNQFNAYSIHCGVLLANDAEDNLKKIFQAASQNQPSVILFDQIDILCQKDASKRPQGSPISFLVCQMGKIKQQNTYLIGTTSNPEKIDISLKKLDRFEKVIPITTNTDICREEILKKLLEDVRKEITNQEIVQLSKITSGYMAADLVMLIKEATIQCLLQKQNAITASHLQKALKFVQPILKKEGFTDIPVTTLQDVGGLKHIKQELEREIIIPMRQQAQFKQINFDIQSGGVLLYGPPGCGKTMLAKAIANAVRANFIIVKGPELLNKYVGQSQQAVREVFGRAQRAAPCVIFFDEFDALAPKRSDQGNQVTERVVNTLLTALDGVEQRKMVFVIAATNRKDMIDEATLRAGRIQKHVYVPRPTLKEREEILSTISKNMKLQAGISFKEVAEQTDGFSGADLKFLIKEATVTAVIGNRKSVSQCDIDQALKQVLQSRENEDIKGKSDDMIREQDPDDKYVFEFERTKKNDLPEQQQQKQRPRNEKKNNNAIINEFINFLGAKLNKK